MSSANTIKHQEKQNIIAATDECVMCGLCLPHCPTYSITKNESESPRGRISLVRALYENKLEASDSIASHLDHCLTCMNCEHACPANVDYEKIIDAGRAITRNQNKNLQQRLLLLILSKSNIRTFIKPFITIFRIIGLHRLFPNLRAISLLPTTNNQLNITDYKITELDNKQGNKPNIVIINSCAADLINDQTFNSAKLILSKLGCNVIQQKQTHCCGALHQHTGDLKTATALRNKLLKSIEIKDVDHIASLASGCGAQMVRYPLLEGTPIATQFSNKLIDINELVLQQLVNNELGFNALSGKVYLHKPCSQQQLINDPNTVERLLQHIPNIEIIHFKDPLTCCGAGGVNTITETKLADQLIENKIHEITSSPANYLVSSNIGCALHFQAQLKRKNIHVKICHPITLLAQQVI
ncbi:MAG: (Fe-S)-binding protein [Gammaproteobacteria bacterium]